jgi:hypothetical protein
MRKTLKLGIVALIIVIASFALGISAAAEAPPDHNDINFADETIEIAGNYNELEYSTDGKTWKDVWGPSLNISGLISTTEKRIYFRDKLGTAVPSENNIPIPARAPTDTAGVVYSGETGILTAPNGYEYKTGLFGWTDIPAGGIDVSRASVTTQISVRKEASQTAFATTPATVTVPISPTATLAPVYDLTSDSIKGLTSAMEIGVKPDSGDPEFISIAYGKTSLTRTELAALFYQSYTKTADTVFLVRVKATSSVPASKTAEVTVPGASVDAPVSADFSIDYKAETLTPKNTSTVYEYSKDDKTWTAITPPGGDAVPVLNLTSIIPPATSSDGAVIQIRVKAVASTKTPASEAVSLTVEKRPATPTKADVYYDMAAEKFVYAAGVMATLQQDSGRGYAAASEDFDVPEKIATVRFRVAPVAPVEMEAMGSFASAVYASVVPARPAAPKGVTYDAAKDSVKGFKNTLQIAYAADASATPDAGDYIDYADFGKASLTRAELVKLFDDYDGENVGYIAARTKATAAAPASNLAYVEIPAPAGEVDESGFTINYETEKLTAPTGKTYEYRKVGANAWTQFPDNGTLNLTPLIPAATTAAASQTIEIRAKAVAAKTGVAASPASDAVTFDLVKRPATPTKTDVYYDMAAEKFVYASADVMATLQQDNGQGYAAAAETQPVSSRAVAVKFRVAAVEDVSFASAAYSTTVPARPKVPTTPRYTAASDAITGVSAAMEYSAVAAGAPAPSHTDATWQKFTATTAARGILGVTDQGGDVYVRVAATAAAPRSEAVKASFPASETTSPDLKVDFTAEKLVDVNGADLTNVSELEFAKYNADGVLPAKPDWNGVPAAGNLTALIPAAGKADLKIAVRYKSTIVKPASTAAVISVPARPAGLTKDQMKFNGLGPQIDVSGFADYVVEQAKGVSTSYTPVTGGSVAVPAEAASQKYKFRVAAVEDVSFASAAFTLTVPSQPKAPTSPKYAGGSDSITGVSVNMEWTYVEGSDTGAVDWTGAKRFTGGTAARGVFSNAIGGYDEQKDYTIIIRTTATISAFASRHAEVKLPRVNSATPTGLAIDFGTEKLTGTTTAMEYQKAGATSWTVLAKDASLTNLIPASTAAANLNIAVRYKATSTTPASAAEGFTIPRRPATPTASEVSYDYRNERFVTSLQGLEYAVGSGVYNDWPAGGELAATSSTQSVKVRVKAVEGVSFASLPLTVSVASRPAAPNAVKWNAAKHAVTGFTASMEYRIDAGPWTDAAAGMELGQGANEAIPATGAVIYVRLKATATKPFSAEKKIEVSPAP